MLKVYTGNQQHLIAQEFQNLSNMVAMLFPAEDKPEAREVKTEADFYQLMKMFES